MRIEIGSCQISTLLFARCCHFRCHQLDQFSNNGEAWPLGSGVFLSQSSLSRCRQLAAIDSLQQHHLSIKLSWLYILPCKIIWPLSSRPSGGIHLRPFPKQLLSESSYILLEFLEYLFCRFQQFCLLTRLAISSAAGSTIKRWLVLWKVSSVHVCGNLFEVITHAHNQTSG